MTVLFPISLGVMFYYSLGERGAFGEVLPVAENLGLQQYALLFVPREASVPEAIW
ncbi:hypothetical protein [Natronorubrum sp. DTA7]|uniref:hypothetical protein n=1 Tax=Natronorubrum sp. DTA7 TaxID=3447016 RepID=UPI003F84FF17